MNNALNSYFNEKFNNPYTLAFRSAPEASVVLFDAWGVCRGDAVFLPVLSSPYIVRCIHLFGATPVFCDINPKTLCIDINSVKKEYDRIAAEKKLEPRLVVADNFCGKTPDIKSLSSFCNQNGLLCAEVNNHSTGAGYGDAAICSYEGEQYGVGMLNCPNERLFSAVNAAVTHARGAYGTLVPCVEDIFYKKLAEQKSVEEVKENMLLLANKLSLTPAVDFNNLLCANRLPFFVQSEEQKAALPECREVFLADWLGYLRQIKPALFHKDSIQNALEIEKNLVVLRTDL